MNLGEAFVEAYESISSNKLRSGLTMLGIVIGVAAVIAMLGVGQGAQDTILTQISGIGSNLLFVFSGNRFQDVRNPEPLTMADAEAIADPFQAPSVAGVAPIIVSNLGISYDGEQTSAEVYGVTPDYERVRNEVITEGSFITEEHMLGLSSVALLGPDLAEKLFGRTDGLVGETIRIAGQPFRVIGVLKSRGGSSFGSQDNIALIPLTTARSRVIRRERDNLDMIYIQASSADLVDQASEEVSQVLRTRHHLLLEPDDFTIFSQNDFVQVASTITGVFKIFLSGVAGISLLVGGIGIMNIMLVSVIERTREIGLRKAVGARKRDIMIQFLTESSLISLFGGLIGIGLGYIIAFAVGQIAAASNTPLAPNVRLDTILLATLFSTAVGLFFGMYPANRAASLQPVEALRHD